jgi:hypothetical protein
MARRRMLSPPRGFAGLATITVVLALAFVFAGSSLADGGTFSWNQINGATACDSGTTGTILWIFNPHSDAVPTSLTITWSDGTTDTYTGDWTNPGGGQNWHDTETIVGEFPPQSASLTYTGTLGSNPILTISGCNEGGGGTPTAAAPTVSKDAAQNQDTEYGWQIDKAVDKTEIDPTPGGTATFHYTVTVTHDGGSVTTSDVTGTITVFNNAGGDITLSGITDELSDGTTCDVDTSGGLTIAANGSKDFPYTCGLSAPPTDAPDTTNTATITWDAQPLSDGSDLAAGSADTGSVPVDFTSSVSDDCVDVTDSVVGDLSGATVADPFPTCVGGAGDNNGTFTFTYSKTFNAPPLGSCVGHDNTASFADNSTPQNTGSDDQSVTVCTFNAPLTIGYWGNHLASSSKSSALYDNYCKSPLSGTGCSSNGPWTKQFLPKPLGNFSVSSVAIAAAVFRANNCSNASSSSQNAVGCLAAQLLAAELNVANVSNPCINPTIASANAFLVSIGYVGPTGTYSLTTTQRNTALGLKDTLVNYNQGGGC